MVWAVVIGVILLLLAVGISYWVFVVVEDEHHFLYIIGAFFGLFVIGTGICFWLLPDLKSGASVSALVRTWVQPDMTAKAEGSDLPLLK